MIKLFTARLALRFALAAAAAPVAAVPLAAAVLAMEGSAQAAQLVVVESRSCHYCANFNREIVPGYQSTEAGRAAPIRSVSPLKKWPADLAGVQPVAFTPVFIVVDNGREVGRFAGYNGEASFWSRLNPLLQKAG